MTYPNDPGGNFASDAHRRIMAHLPNPDDDPITLEDLILNCINRDPHTLTHFGNATEVLAVLEDLKSDGYAKQLKAGWKTTTDGFDVLTGPPTERAMIAPSPAAIGLDKAQLLPNGDT